jgi:elongation factor Ts
MVEVNCETDFVARTPEFQSLVRDIAMHVAAASPLYTTKEEVPAEVLEKEKEIYKSQAAAQGKPAPVQDKIAEGKLKQYYSDFVLLEQPFVKDTQLTISQLVAEKVGTLKENIVVRRFARFKVGEESK